MDLTQQIGLLITILVEAGWVRYPAGNHPTQRVKLNITSIRSKRLKLGLTQLTLAKRAGLTEIKLSRLECGRERLRPELADKLLTALQFFAPGDGRKLA